MALHRDRVRRTSGAVALVLIVSMTCWGCALLRPGGGPFHGPRGVRHVTLLDNLGDADATSRLAVDGREGYSIAFDQAIGLLFHVERPTVVTQVGGFIQSLNSYDPKAADVIVEIHPALADGRPDRDTVLAAAPVSAQRDVNTIAFQIANIRTFLQPGDYYALFALAVQRPPATIEALAISSGLRQVGPDTFVPYNAPVATGGVTHPSNYDPSVQQFRGPLQIGERVLGVVVPRGLSDCAGDGWRDLADEHGAGLRDERHCIGVAQGLGVRGG